MNFSRLNTGQARWEVINKVVNLSLSTCWTSYVVSFPEGEVCFVTLG